MSRDNMLPTEPPPDVENFFDKELEGKTCDNCKVRPATQWWCGDGGIMGFIHGARWPWCMICITEEQLKHARERAAEIPALEDKLQKLMDAEVRVAEAIYDGEDG